MNLSSPWGRCWWAPWWARSKLAHAATAAQAQGFQAGQQQAHHEAALCMAKLQGQLLELTNASGELSSGNQSLRDELGRELSAPTKLPTDCLQAPPQAPKQKATARVASLPKSVSRLGKSLVALHGFEPRTCGL